MATQENSVEALRELIDQENGKIENEDNAFKIVVTDEAGKILYKTKQVKEQQIDLHEEIRHVMGFTMNQPFENAYHMIETSREEFTTLVPLTLQDKIITSLLVDFHKEKPSQVRMKVPYLFHWCYVVYRIIFLDNKTQNESN